MGLTEYVYPVSAKEWKLFQSEIVDFCGDAYEPQVWDNVIRRTS